MSSPVFQPHSSRRRFLARQLKWLLAGTLAALAAPLLRFAGFTVKPKPKHVTVAKALPAGAVHTERDFILFVGDAGARAVSRRCTHLGCRVNYRMETGIIECPCHQSQFSPEGIRLAGPAQKNLDVFPVRLLEDDQGAVTAYEVTL